MMRESPLRPLHAVEEDSGFTTIHLPPFPPESHNNDHDDDRRRLRQDTKFHRRQQRRTTLVLLMAIASIIMYLGRFGANDQGSSSPHYTQFPSATPGEEDNEFDIAAASIASNEAARLRGLRNPGGDADHHSTRVFSQVNYGEAASPASSVKVEPTANDLRYLALGTSTTWGSGLADPSVSSYPNLLSSTLSTNAAQRSGGSLKYAAACTRSLVVGAERRDSEVGFYDSVGKGWIRRPNGDDFIEWHDDANGEEYDVIVIEFLVKAADGLIPLAKRLRRRYPRALMIFVRLWGPLAILDAKGRTVRQWWSEKRLGERDGSVLGGRDTAGPLHNEDFKAAFEKAASRGKFRWRKFNEQYAIQDEAVKEVGGYLLTMERPDKPIDALDHLHLFAFDWVHLSEAGHAWMADRVRSIVSSVLVEGKWTPTYDVDLADVKEQGTWGSKRDHCNAWTDTGIIPFKHSPNAQMEEFDPVKHKHALAVPGHWGSVSIINPEPTPADLFVGYMSTGPLNEEEMWKPHYPPTRAEILTQDWKSSFVQDSTLDHRQFVTNVGDDGEPGMLLNPVVEGYGYPVHVSLTSYVGVIQPGENTVVFRPLIHGGAEIMPFRLVSTSIIATAAGKEEDTEGMDTRPEGVHFEGGVPASMLDGG